MRHLHGIRGACNNDINNVWMSLKYVLDVMLILVFTKLFLSLKLWFNTKLFLILPAFVHQKPSLFEEFSTFKEISLSIFDDLNNHVKTSFDAKVCSD